MITSKNVKRKSVSRKPNKSNLTKRNTKAHTKYLITSRTPNKRNNKTNSNKAIKQVSMRSEVKRFDVNDKVKKKEKIKQQILDEFIKKKNKYLLNKKNLKLEKNPGSNSKARNIKGKSTQKLNALVSHKSHRKHRKMKMASTMNIKDKIVPRNPRNKSQNLLTPKKSSKFYNSFNLIEVLAR
jgi:hypothetical protein